MTRLQNATLQDVCTLVTDGTHDTPKTLDSGVPFIKAKQINDGIIEFADCEFISYEDHLKIISRSKPEKGDTLFAHIGASLGEAAYVNTDLEFSIKNVALFKPDPKKIIPRYLYYLVINNEFQDGIKNRRTGSAQPFVSLDILRTNPIRFIENIATQRRIADILSAYDDLIENNFRRIRILEELAQAIYQEWFGKVDKESLPEGWKTRKLSDLVSLIRRTTNAGKHLENLPYIPIDIIPRHSLALTESKPDSEAQSSLILFNKDDVLFGAMRSYFHKVVVAPFDGVTRQTCFVLRPKSPDYYSFAVMTLFQDSTVAYSHAHARGSTMPYAVWEGSLAEMPVTVPPPNKAVEFNSIVKPVLETIQLSYFRQNNLRQTRDLLLPRLVNGEIEISELDEN